MTDTSAITDILTHCRTVAVVGLSPKTHRDSHHVSAYMQAQGWRVIPVNPSAREILGETCYPSLTEAAQHHRIDLVNVFRNSDDVPPIAEEAVAIGARGIWLQMGVRHDAALHKAQDAGLWTVQDRCLMVEHRRRA